MINYTRGKDKIKTDFKLVDIYKFYKSKSDKPLSTKLFRSICQEFNEKILKEVVYEGHDFNMGARLGSIRIRKFNNAPKLNEKGEVNNRFFVDWKATKNRWTELYPDKTAEEIKEIKNKPVVYHLNEHTDNWVMKWHWDKITCNVLNQAAYRFEPQREIKREAARAWKTVPGMKDIYYE